MLFAFNCNFLFPTVAVKASQQGYLIDTETRERLEFQYNPNKIGDDKSTQYLCAAAHKYLKKGDTVTLVSRQVNIVGYKRFNFILASLVEKRQSILAF
jgi:hypothetical protein